MCFSESTFGDQLGPPLIVDSDSSKLFTRTLDAMACRPSWTVRNLFKQQPARSGLPRRFYGSAKINLNNYWNVLEDLVNVTTKSKISLVNCDNDEEQVANEINENLANDRKEEDDEVTFSMMEVDAALPKFTQPILPRPLHKLMPSRTRIQSKIQPDQASENSPVEMAPSKVPVPAQILGSPRTPLATINSALNHGLSGAINKSLSPLPASTDIFSRKLNKHA